MILGSLGPRAPDGAQGPAVNCCRRGARVERDASGFGRSRLGRAQAHSVNLSTAFMGGVASCRRGISIAHSPKHIDACSCLVVSGGGCGLLGALGHVCRSPFGRRALDPQERPWCNTPLSMYLALAGLRCSYSECVLLCGCSFGGVAGGVCLRWESGRRPMRQYRLQGAALASGLCIGRIGRSRHQVCIGGMLVANG